MKRTVLKCLPFFLCIGNGLHGSGTVELLSVDWGHVTYDQHDGYSEVSLTDGTVYMGTQADLSLKPHHRGYRLYSLSEVPGDVEVVRVRYEAPLRNEKADRKAWVGAGPFSADLEGFMALDPRDKYSAIGKPEGIFLVRNPRTSTQEGTADASMNSYCSWESNPGGIFGVSIHAEVVGDFLKDSWYSNSALRLFVDFLPMDTFPMTVSDREFSDKVEIQWDAAPGADAYVIYRGGNETFGEAEILEHGYIGSSYSDTGLEPDSIYFYWIAGRNDIGVGQPNGPHEGRTAIVVIPSYLISGNVTFNGTGLVDTGISLSGGGGSTATDGNGDFSIEVDAGWSGSITPNKSGYSFSPSSRSLVNIGSNQPGQNFTAARMPTSVSLSGDLAFGPVEVGAASMRGLSIENVGDVTLTVSNIETPSGFRCVWSGDILSGQSMMVEVFFEPTLPGDYSGEIVVHGNVAGGQAGISASGVGYVPNTAPTVGEISDRSVDEDGSTGAIGFVVDDEETAPADLTVSAVSSDTGLIALSGIAFGGSGANRTVTVTPLPNQSGEATITVKVSDGALSASEAFVLTVNPINDAPEISDIADRTISVDTDTGAIGFTVSDLESSAGSLTVTSSSSNPGLVPVDNIVVGGDGAARTVTVTPTAGQSGATTITVTVSDGQKTSSDTFVVTVTGVNSAPTITQISNRTIDEDASTGAIGFVVDDLETAPGDLTVTVGSSGTSLVPISGILLGGNGADRTVTVTPSPDRNGKARITLTVSDGTASSSEEFDLTVNPVNDAPEIGDIANQAIGMNSDTGPIGFSVSDLERPSSALAVSGQSSNTALVNTSRIAFGGFGDDRTVTVFPLLNQSGEATITVTVSDGLLKTSKSFLISVSDGTETVSIVITSPANGTELSEGDTIEVSGMVSDPSKVLRVEMLVGSEKIAEDSSSPYSFSWNGATVGDHIIGLRAVLKENGTVDSATVTVTVGTSEVTEVLKPSITPDGGTHMGMVEASMSTETDGALIYFTIDGSEPTTASSLYVAEILIGKSVTLKARAFLEGSDPSPVSVADFVIEPGFVTRSVEALTGASVSASEVQTPNLRVTLSVVPPDSNAPFALIEFLPVGWAAMNISGSGVWDPDNSKIEWSSLEGPLVLTYDLTGTDDPRTAQQILGGLGGHVEYASQSIPIVSYPLVSVLENLSSRSRAGTGAEILIPGFVVVGSGEKTFLIRAVGPGLERYGVSGFLEDPVMVLVDGLGDEIDYNDNWSDGADPLLVESITARIGAFPLDSGSKDGALVARLAQDRYTVKVSGKDGSVGVALVEVYDAGVDPASDIRLMNVSNRGVVGTGASVMIPGFVVDGEMDKTILIRAVGPGLTQYGVSGTLGDPKLEVFRSGETVPISGATNNDWGDAANSELIAAASNRIGAFPLEKGSADAVLLIRLEPGVYTIKASGTGGTTGVTLVEVYILEDDIVGAD